MFQDICPTTLDAAPKVWNKLPSKLWAASDINSFKTGLKTYLFIASY